MASAFSRSTFLSADTVGPHHPLLPLSLRGTEKAWGWGVGVGRAAAEHSSCPQDPRLARASLSWPQRPLAQGCSLPCGLLFGS